jgi:hypothetical protein
MYLAIGTGFWYLTCRHTKPAHPPPPTDTQPHICTRTTNHYLFTHTQHLYNYPTSKRSSRLWRHLTSKYGERLKHTSTEITTMVKEKWKHFDKGTVTGQTFRFGFFFHQKPPILMIFHLLSVRCLLQIHLYTYSNSTGSSPGGEGRHPKIEFPRGRGDKVREHTVKSNSKFGLGGHL